MAHYCDSKVLERNWFLWLLARSAPDLEVYRAGKTLWTRLPEAVLARLKGPRAKGTNPMSGELEHIVVGPEGPLRFMSYCGEVDLDELPDPMDCQHVEDYLRLEDGKHAGDYLRWEPGFFLEQPIWTSWDAITRDVNRICTGIAAKFTLPTDDDYKELVSEATAHILGKIDVLKLVYTPGLAPVFNLLTTAIWHSMLSALNKKNNAFRKRLKLAENIMNRTIDTSTRSLRTAGSLRPRHAVQLLLRDDGL